MRKRILQVISALTLLAIMGWGTQAAAQEQKTIIAGFASIVRSLDPATQIAGEEGSLNWVIYDNLVTFDRQDFNKIVPSLAESWEISPDGKTYTFKLRPGVKFSTGNEMTADDVVYSFERGFRINHPNYPSKDLNLVEGGVKKIDDHTVSMTINEPFSAFLTLLTNSHLGVVDSKTLEANKSADDPDGTAYLNDHTLGTGPFMLDEWKRNEYVRLVKNPNYWGIPINYFRVPKYDVFIDQNIPESSVQKFALDNGDIQMAYNLTGDDIVAYESNPDFEVVKAQTWVATAILMNPKEGTILADPNVRNAIRYAIDYDSIITDILKGYAVPLERAFWQPFIGSLKEGDTRLYEYNLDKAKEYMAKSAHPDGGEFTIVIGTGGGFGAPWEIIAGKEAADLEKIGIKMNISQADWSVVDEKSVNGDYEAMQIWTGTFVNEAAGHIMSHVYPGKAFFMAKNAYQNKRIEELSDIVLRETDPAKRIAAIDEINKISAEDGPYAWVAQKLATYVFPKNVGGFDGYPGPYQFDYAVLHYKE